MPFIGAIFLSFFFSPAGRKVLLIMGIIGLVLFAMILGWSWLVHRDTQAQIPAPLEVTASTKHTCTLVKVQAGDQLTANCEGYSSPINLSVLGVITPQIGTNAPGQHSKCGAAAAKMLTESELHDKPFQIATDPKAQQHDENGNLLVHIWSLNDGALISQCLIEKGYAIADTTITDTALKQPLMEKQRSAKQKNLGNWMACPKP